MSNDIVQLIVDKYPAPAPVPEKDPTKWIEEEITAHVEYTESLNDIARNLAALTKAAIEAAYRYDSVRARDEDKNEIMKAELVFMSILDAAERLADAILNTQI